MKLFIALAAVLILIVSAGDCGKKPENQVKYKGRLEITGICMNYTIKLLKGEIDSSKIVANWIDESTGKSYTDVFGLGNPCNFPATIKQADEFYFYIDSVGKKNCITCLAYYPTPSKKLSIIVVEK
jgi:hypothetical protein